MSEDEITLPDGFRIHRLDVVYPPMLWTTVWLAQNPASPAAVAFFKAAGVDFGPWTPGLYLLNQQGGYLLVPDAGPDLAGITLSAYTRHHAVYLLPSAIAARNDIVSKPDRA